MKFLEKFIHYPVWSLALAIAICLFGIMGITKMPLREFPVFTPSKISITTDYPGASPSVMEGFVATPIQHAIASVRGIDYIEALNMQNTSQITVKLFQGYDINKALTQINTRIASIRWKLPKDILNPSIAQQPSSSSAIYLGLSSKTHSLEAITNYFRRTLLPKLQNTKGIEYILQIGARDYAMRIWLNPIKMSGFKVTAGDVEKAINDFNAQPAVGRLKGTLTQYNLTANSLLHTADEFNEIVVKRGKHYLVRLKDIGYAKLGTRVLNQAAYVDGKPGVIVGTAPSNTAGNIAVADRVLKALPDMRARAPKGLKLTVLWNTSQFSKDSLHNVIVTIGLAVLFVMIIVALFLGSIRAIAIPFFTIPLSLLGACGMLYLLDFSLNSMTLLAFALAIGLVVDDAIVVLENTHRHIEAGLSRLEAALLGLREIAPAIFVMTLVVAVVFVPIAFTTGITGVLFKEFAFTLSITVLFSGLFALCLTPMMCGHLLVPPKQHGFSGKVDQIFTSLSHGYRWLLEWTIRFRIAVVALLIAIFALLFILFHSTPSALLPQENQGVVLGIGVAPTYANLSYSEKIAEQMAHIFERVKNRKHFGVVIGYPNGVTTTVISWMVLQNHKPGQPTENQVIENMRPKLAAIPGAMAFPMNRPPLVDVSGFSVPVNFVLQTTGSYQQLYEVANKLKRIAENNPHFINVRDNLKINTPSVKLHIDRLKAAKLGVPIKQITDDLNLLLGKPIVGWFQSGSWSYPIVPQLIHEFRKNPKALDLIHVRTASGKLIPLSTLVTYKMAVSPYSLNQFQQLKSATISANITQDYTLGQALNFLDNEANKVMPKNMQYTYSKESRIFKRASGEMAFLFIGALLAVYLLMVLKFASFIDPLVVLISVPLSMVGAFIAIKIMGANLNIYTEIGLLMLIGLISKQGILIVDFANNIQTAGNTTIREAILDAATIRLRPILMTTFAMIFGAIPLACAQGAGHVALSQIGAVIIGGLIVGSLFSLFVVPTIYTFLAHKHKKVVE
jgi:multidrug efflux pump